MLTARSVDELAKADESATLVDENSPTIRRFVEMLEQRMLEGHSEASNRTWATLELGCPPAKFQLIQSIILKQWKLAGTTTEVTSQRRDQIRQQYQHLYKEALNKGKLKEALHALDAQVKLDGLDQPPEGSLEDKIIGGAITNAARETVGRLVAKARELAERGIPQPLALASPISDKTVTVETTPGGKVIDLRERNK
jgi:hypothetical protein